MVDAARLTADNHAADRESRNSLLISTPIPSKLSSYICARNATICAGRRREVPGHPLGSPSIGKAREVVAARSDGRNGRLLSGTQNRPPSTRHISHPRSPPSTRCRFSGQERKTLLTLDRPVRPQKARLPLEIAPTGRFPPRP